MLFAILCIAALNSFCSFLSQEDVPNNRTINKGKKNLELRFVVKQRRSNAVKLPRSIDIISKRLHEP
ncbi:hypothetical protein KCU74_g124, partial [Aureobasidium melanogenum]